MSNFFLYIFCLLAPRRACRDSTRLLLGKVCCTAVRIKLKKRGLKQAFARCERVPFMLLLVSSTNERSRAKEQSMHCEIFSCVANQFDKLFAH